MQYTIYSYKGSKKIKMLFKVQSSRMLKKYYVFGCKDGSWIPV